MKIRNNAPEIYSTFQDQALRAPSIEDGNVPAGELQGKIFTSEITLADDYSISYIAALSFAPTANLRETGTLNTYTFVITYTATLEPAPATNPGFFGSNIIKEGDPFTVKSPSSINAHDWVRGYISKINNVSFTVLGSVYTYTYTLSCTVTQGQPLDMKAGDRFSWNRQLYQDPSTFNDANPPINLSVSYDKNTSDLYFYWDDANQESRKYRIMAREVDDPSNYFIYYVNGLEQNPDVSLTPFLGGGTITTIKINKPVNNIASPKMLDIKGAGSGALAVMYPGSDGSLTINEFTVYDATVGTNDIYVYSDKPITKYFGNKDWPTPNLFSYIDGLPVLLGTSDFYVDNYTQVNPGNNRYLKLDVRRADGGLINITPAWRSSILNTKVSTHDGVLKVSGGSYIGKIIASPKKTSDRARFYADPAIFGAFLPGTMWAFSVSAIYDEINKLYTEWSTEEYIKF